MKVVSLNEFKAEKQYRNFNHNINLAYDNVYLKEENRKRGENIAKNMIRGYMSMLSNFQSMEQ